MRFREDKRNYDEIEKLRIASACAKRRKVKSCKECLRYKEECEDKV